MLIRLSTVCLLAACVGCGKSSSSAPASSATPAPALAAPAETPAEAPSAEPAPAAAAVDQAQIAAVIAELTQAVRKYGVEQRRAPKTLDELVAGGYLSQAPTPPAGKKFAIDKNLQVYLTDR